MSGWQNADVQGVCTLFWGWQGWQEGDRSVRAQPGKGKWVLVCAPPYGYSLSRSKSSCIIRFEDAWRQDAVKFSREFGGLLRPKYCLARHLALNSRENLIPEGAYFHRNSGSSSELGQGKQLLYCPFSDCVRTLLSPSCHPCHPQKRVQTPCTSAFCHPDTLFSKNIVWKFVLNDTPCPSNKSVWSRWYGRFCPIE